MASRNGSATVAPSPRRTVRRGNALVVRKDIRSLLRLIRSDPGCPHLKRGTLDDAHDERRPAVVAGGRIANNLTNGGPIVVLETAAKRIRQELGRHRCRKL